MSRLGTRFTLGTALGLFLLGVGWTQTAQVVGQPPIPPPPGGSNSEPAQPNAEALTRGPVHEAFAIPVNTGRKAGLVVPRQPPNPVEEIPPDAKPEGEVVWIPGYFSWDDDRKDFVWVSGVWRVPPPGYHWVPGYWNQVPQGYQWVSGFWQPVAAQEVEYLPQPPETLDQGPTGTAPAADYIWISGGWRWSETRYMWQPGYWTQVNPDWVWIPANYYWSPRGWVFCAAIGTIPWHAAACCLRRFVSWARSLITARRSPWTRAILTVSLFVRPRYCHYYFGDYYAAEYEGLGIYPWFSFGSPRFGYDPLFSYYRWYYDTHYHDLAWERNLHGWFDYYRGHPAMRPPHTWVAQQQLLREPGMHDRPGLAIGVPLRQLASVRLESVAPRQAELIRQSIHQEREFHAERRQLEAPGGRRPPGGPVVPERASLARMPSYNAMHAQQHDFRAVQSPQHGSNPGGGNPAGRYQPQPAGSTFRQPSYQGKAAEPSSGGAKQQKDKHGDRNTGSGPPRQSAEPCVVEPSTAGSAPRAMTPPEPPSPASPRPERLRP